MSAESRTPSIPHVLERATLNCKARPNKRGPHDTVRTEETRIIPHPPNGFEQHVWVCRRCGERSWWW